jgi:hypothetical protein
MAKIRMNDSLDLDKFDPYKDTLVTTVRGTEEEFREVLDKLMGGKTNMPEYKTMSLIKKDDVIKAIGEEVLNVTRNMPWSAASKEMARNTLYALKQTVQEMPEIEKSVWISVKEKMPSKGEKVLLYIPEREGCKQHGMYLAEIEKVEADPKGEHNLWGLPTPGSNWSIDGWSYFEEPIVTHWMPLPDAPEVDDE